MRRNLLDTDILSHYLKGHPKVVARAAEYRAAFGKLDFSVVTYYEVRRGLVHAGLARKLTAFESLADVSNIWVLDRPSAQEASSICAQMWQRGVPLDDADILIAGTARANRLVVVSNNVAHFSRVPGIEVENWLE